MQRTWLVLLVLGGVVLAGCSAPGTSPSDADGSADVSYPDGWGPDGPDNASRVADSADETVGGEDFAERWVSVETANRGMEADYLVVVTEVRADRDRERLLNLRSFYLVDDELAASVAEAGSEPLANRTANEVRRTYINSSGGVQYHRLEDRTPRTAPIESGDFASATDQPLPAALIGSAPVFESAAYADPAQTDAGVRYSIANVSAFHIDGGAGHLTVGSDGLVTGYDVSEADPESEEAFRYELEVGDVSVEPPEWTG